RHAVAPRARAARPHRAAELLCAALPPDLPALLRRARGLRRVLLAASGRRGDGAGLTRSPVPAPVPHGLGAGVGHAGDHMVARGGGAVLSAVAADRAFPAALRARGARAPAD